jgi:hypothetical protein
MEYNAPHDISLDLGRNKYCLVSYRDRALNTLEQSPWFFAILEWRLAVRNRFLFHAIMESGVDAAPFFPVSCIGDNTVPWTTRHLMYHRMQNKSP